MRGKLGIIYLFLIILCAWSCSTTRVIPEGESRLADNIVKIHNLKDFPRPNISESEMYNYIKQKPNTYFVFGWNPFLNMYNWSNGKGGCWDRFVRKLGQAPVIYDASTVNKSAKNIKNHLVYKGYYNSVVKDSVVTKHKKTNVFYNIELKDRYFIDSIKYDIKDSALAAIFFKDTIKSFLKSGEMLSEQLLESESERASQVFRNRGYYGFSKNYFFYKADTVGKGGKANLLVSINDYTRNESQSSAKPHKVFYIDSVNIDLVKSSAIYLNPAEREEVITDNYKGINITYTGNKPFLLKKVIARLNSIEPGLIYREQTVSNTYSRFSNIGLFSAVNVQVNETDTNKVSTNIKLVSSQMQGYRIGFNVSANASALFGFSPSISYYHKNLFRGGEYFNISFMGDFQYWFGKNKRSSEFGISTSLSIPKFLFVPSMNFKRGTMPRTAFSLSYSFQKRPEYTRNIMSGKYGYTWRRRGRFYTWNPIQLNVIHISDLEQSFLDNLDNPFLRNSYQNHFDLGMGFGLYYTTNPRNDKSISYFYLTSQTDIAGNLISAFNGLMKRNDNGEYTFWNTPYSQYVREEVSMVYTWKFGADRNNAIATRFLIGIGTGYGNSNVLPFEKLFWSGGANSLRAWQARTIGPGYAQRDTTWSLPNQTGEFRLEANIEYRFPLFWMFQGALFVDAGNIWNLKSSDIKGVDTENFEKGLFRFNNFYRHIALDCGLGLRLDIGFALFRVDMGFKTYDPAYSRWNAPNKWLRNNNYAVQFGVGYPF